MQRFPARYLYLYTFSFYLLTFLKLHRHLFCYFDWLGLFTSWHSRLTSWHSRLTSWHSTDNMTFGTANMTVRQPTWHAVYIWNCCIFWTSFPWWCLQIILRSISTWPDLLIVLYLSCTRLFGVYFVVHFVQWKKRSRKIIVTNRSRKSIVLFNTFKCLWFKKLECLCHHVFIPPLVSLSSTSSWSIPLRLIPVMLRACSVPVLIFSRVLYWEVFSWGGR